MVTHDTRLAEELSDHVRFLDKGIVLFFGTVSDLKRSSEPLMQEFLRDDQLEATETSNA